jgi:hypothetical protein
VAHRLQHQEHTSHSKGSHGGRLDLIIAIALGLVAIVTAGSVYLNEKQEHKATVDFHQATQLLVTSTALGPRTPAGKAAEAESKDRTEHAEDQQEKATRYTLVEVILASSLFLLGVAGVAREREVKIGSLVAAAVTFVSALILLAGA